MTVLPFFQVSNVSIFWRPLCGTWCAQEWTVTMPHGIANTHARAHTHIEPNAKS